MVGRWKRGVSLAGGHPLGAVVPQCEGGGCTDRGRGVPLGGGGGGIMGCPDVGIHWWLWRTGKSQHAAHMMEHSLVAVGISPHVQTPHHHIRTLK